MDVCAPVTGAKPASLLPPGLLAGSGYSSGRMFRLSFLSRLPPYPGSLAGYINLTRFYHSFLVSQLSEKLCHK